MTSNNHVSATQTESVHDIALAFPRCSTRSCNPRFAFTLVELLVTIAIIGVLMALLLPAVNAARESARSSECRYRIRTLTLATINFEQSKGRYPGYAEDFFQGYPYSPHLVKEASWLIPILPYKDPGETERELIEAWRDNNILPGAPNLVAYLRDMVCPSSTSDDVTRTTPGSNSYVSNNGFYLRATDPAGTVRTYNSRPLDIERSDNGVFRNRIPPPAGAPVGTASRANLETNDGATNTLLFSENLDALPRHVVGRTGNGMVWLYASDQPPATGRPAPDPPPSWSRINGSVPTTPPLPLLR